MLIWTCRPGRDLMDILKRDVGVLVFIYLFNDKLYLYINLC